LRYNNIETVTFTDPDGNKIAVKDTRPIQQLQTGVALKVEQGMELDEIMSRKEYYGDGSEDLAYALFDHNIIKLVEAKFDISKLKELNVPIVEDVF
jgi:hypothetical protein